MTFAESKLALSAALALSCILAAAGALDPAEPRTWLMLVGCVALLATGIAIGERIAGPRGEQPRTLTQIYRDEASEGAAVAGAGSLSGR